MLDQYEQKIVDDVKAFGWHCLGVAADEEGPSFFYTIGVQPSYKHPELIIIGLPPEKAHGVLISAVESIKAGVAFAASCTSDEVIEGFLVAFDPVLPDRIEEYFGAGLWYRRHARLKGPLQAVQLCWPDADGRFPWQRGCNKSVRAVQPLLSARSSKPSAPKR